MQDVADDHHVLHRGVGHRRAIGVRAAAPALQNRVVQHVDESQAEVPAGPHGAGAAPVDERGDVVVVDVTLSAVPSLQPRVVEQVIASDASVLEAEVEDVAYLHCAGPLGVVTGRPDFDHGVVEGVDNSGSVVGAGVEPIGADLRYRIHEAGGHPVLIADAALESVAPIPHAHSPIGSCIDAVRIADDIVEHVWIVVVAGYGCRQRMPVAAVPAGQAAVALGPCVRDTRADQQIPVEVQVQRQDVVIGEVAVLSPVVGDIAGEAVDHQNAEVGHPEVQRVAVYGHRSGLEIIRTERLP